jgi:hypothetical protein
MSVAGLQWSLRSANGPFSSEWIEHLCASDRRRGRRVQPLSRQSMAAWSGLQNLAISGLKLNSY